MSFKTLSSCYCYKADSKEWFALLLSFAKIINSYNNWNSLYYHVNIWCLFLEPPHVNSSLLCPPPLRRGLVFSAPLMQRWPCSLLWSIQWQKPWRVPFPRRSFRNHWVFPTLFLFFSTWEQPSQSQQNADILSAYAGQVSEKWNLCCWKSLRTWGLFVSCQNLIWSTELIF